MRVLTAEQEQVLSLLVELAGSPIIVQDALKELNQASGEPPTLEAIVEQILAIKARTRSDEMVGA